jgi:PIN domain-containing protein
MDVLLDTNAVRGSSLEGPAFDSLREYLSKTKSRLLLPSVVVEELCAQRQAEISGGLRKITNAKKDLERLAPGFSAEIPTIDIPAAVAEYRSQLETVAERVDIVDNTKADIKELVRRLANRIPPASPTGEEARDVLIWLTLLGVGSKQEAAFISGDRRAFFQENTLKSELDKELKALPYNIVASPSLDAFLKEHHRRASWVEKDWVEQQVATRRVDDALSAFIEGREERLVGRYLDDYASLTGYINLLQVVQREVLDFFVSDMTAGALLVGVTLWAELELEVEFQSKIHDWRDWRDTPSAKIRVVYPTVIAELEFEVVGNEVKTVSVSDVQRD